MIILIGGESHTGKTLLAQRLLEKLHYPYMSLDHLKMGFIRGFSPPPFSVSDDEAITAYLWGMQTEGMIGGIIRTCLENRQNLIIEGVYLEPRRVRGLIDSINPPSLMSCSNVGDNRADLINQASPSISESRQDSQNSMIKPLFLLFSKQYILGHFDEIIKYENTIEQRFESFDKSCESKAKLITSHQVLKQECEKYNLPFLEIQNDYTSEIEQAFRLLGVIQGKS